jgi:hypothetical protein
MKTAFGDAVKDATLALRRFHREQATRAPWGGPAAPAGKCYETTSVVRRGLPVVRARWG